MRESPATIAVGKAASPALAVADTPSQSPARAGPLVTIAIPTFNRATWLGECLAAVLAQTYGRLEIVVSDNASTDETPEVLRSIGDPRLKVLRQAANIGPIPNQNACLAAARGDYILFVPDDDRISPTFVERCVALIAAEPALPLVIGVCDTFMVEQARMLPARGGRKLGTGVHAGADILREFLEDQVSVQVCTTLYRTEVLRANGGMPGDWPCMADLAAWMPVLAEGRAGFLSEPGGVFYGHRESHTSTAEVNVRLKDLRRVVDLIDGHHVARIADPTERRQFALLVRRYFARHALAMIASQRRHGASLREVFPLIREWAADLRPALPWPGRAHAVGVLHSLALLLLPGPFTRAVRGVLQRHRAKPARETS
jgi:glycosyltransferase involved in cell wall biosynthesis